ncbi:MAG: hypothetical protein SWY16_20180 [Cyanobacteriota bacterium]|nr:hypothetical protein [Cyanobacteriota bacterium]
MSDIRKLIARIASQEEQLQSTCFLAPRTLGGSVRTRVAGLVRTFAPQPSDFEGWGIFQPQNDREAEVIEEADFVQIAEYLQQFPAVRLWLAYRLRGQTWLAYPANESDVRQRAGIAKPVPVCLVGEGEAFESAIARWDGRNWWFEEIDRRVDPIISERLRAELKQGTTPEALNFKGMTPEMKTTYDLVSQRIWTPQKQQQQQQQRDERRLREALEVGGGQLQEFRDRDDFWLVEWTTGDGERHTSAISKADLTVMSAGICLSGEDRNFDLQSLVGVVEDRDESEEW